MYLSRFSIFISKKGLSITDDGSPEFSYRNAYLLVLAGGLSHFFIDMIGHKELEMNFWYGISIDIQRIHSWGDSYYHIYTAWIILGFTIIIFCSLAALSILRLEMKDILTVIVSLIAITAITSIFPGGLIWGELELSMMVIITIFFFIPLSLLGYTLKDISEKPSKPSVSRVSAEKKMIFLYFINIFLGAIITAASIFALVEYEALGNLFDFNGEYIRILGSIVVFVGAFILILSILLPITKNNTIRRILMYIYIPMLPLIFPFAIYLLFNENEIKAQFIKKLVHKSM